MKTIVAIVGTLVLVVAIAIPLFSHHPTWGKRRHMMGYWGVGPCWCWLYGGGCDILTEEQRSQLDRLHQKFYDATAQLKDQIWSKSAELSTLLNSPNPDAEKAKALQKEISGLRAKMAQERIDFELEVGKLAPKGYHGKGYGRGSCSHMGGHGACTWWK